MKAKKFKPRLMVETKRLVLRPYKFSDYAAWKAACEKKLPKQNMFDNGPSPKKTLTRAAYNKGLKIQKARQKKDFVYVFGVFDKKSGEHCGAIDLCILKRGEMQWANLGYAIQNHQWNKGYASEAARAVLELGFKQLKLHRIEAGTHPKNKASIAVAKRIGMKFESVRKNFYYYDGRWTDCLYFVATPEMYGMGRSKPQVGLNRFT